MIIEPGKMASRFERQKHLFDAIGVQYSPSVRTTGTCTAAAQMMASPVQRCSARRQKFPRPGPMRRTTDKAKYIAPRASFMKQKDVARHDPTILSLTCSFVEIEIL